MEMISLKSTIEYIFNYFQIIRIEQIKKLQASELKAKDEY